MNREKLKEYKADENFGNGLVYSIQEVNQVLDEKDAEIEDLLRQNREQCQALQVMYSKEEYGKLQKEIESLKTKLESVQASAYADSVDAGMRERRLRRALYKACANWAFAREVIAANFIDVEDAKKWAAIEAKCLKKAEEYK